ncbi:hypothetical protein [Capillimicrobium parvum]|uniref:Uncharacterized protein n=1 Tax=Capillimicrobium parvum TaxID=2884022 RepID=A0A9E6XTV1_9ACTN|nr:hypothetical protein [Capillimicrobium parvum]UGS34279.1 hypothetical protein DSM104329_00655 [Capillimicrobium parvum]
MTQINRLFSTSPQVAEQVMPFKMSIGDDGRAITFAPFSTFNEGEVGVAVSTASVHRIGQTVLLHRIALADGTAFPYAVALRPDAGLDPAVRAEPLDPRTGSAVGHAQPVDVYVRPVYVDVVAGQGSMLVFLVPALTAAGNWAAAQDMVTRVLELGDGEADGSMPLRVATNRLQITAAAPGPVHVGRRFGLPFTIAVPPQEGAGGVGAAWARHPELVSSADFTTFLGDPTTPSVALLLQQPRRPFVDRWGHAELTPLPFSVTLQAVYLDDTSPALRLIDPDRLARRGQYRGESEGYRFPEGLGDYLFARRAGSAMLRISEPGLFGAGLDFATADIPLEIEPIELILGLTSRGVASDQILMEDEWLDDEGVLVGGFDVRVSLPAIAVPPGDAALVYDSRTMPAYVSATVDPGELTIETIVVQQRTALSDPPDLFGPAGDNVRRSFRIRARIEDTSVAQFWLPADAAPSGAQADYVGDFGQIVRATGPGSTRLTVELLAIGDPLPEECVAYDMPPARELEIVVPEPLVASLASWEDSWFSGANELDFTRPEREVIYKAGTVRGAVAHHRPASQSERITLEVQRPAGADLLYDLREGTLAVDAEGAIAQAVADLRMSSAGGDNRLVLRAWKPINEVVGTGESVAAETLEAVAPVARDLAFAAAPGDGASPPRVVRRELPDMTWTAGRATHSELRARPPSGGTTTLRADATVAYDAEDVRGTRPSLPAETGTHRVEAVAYNDFAATASDTLTVVAPRPEVDVALSVPAGFAGRYRSPNQVGASVARVSADVTVRFALTLEASGPGVDEDDSPDQPFQQRSFAFDLPPGPDELAVGDNAFRFTGRNEFGSGDRTEVVRRRDQVYDFDLVEVSLECLDDNRFLRADVILDGQQIDHVEQSFRVFWSVGPVAESPSPLGFDLVSFEVLRQDSDGDLVSSSSPLLVGISTAGLVGPDYEDLLVVIVVSPSRVLDHEDNIPFDGDTRWLRVALRDSSHGDIPVEAVEV